ncbi:CRISPR-associated endonuclease Cas2 [bacterium]|nr:CRISPR-associated endonuclease Cas2 [bacterium]
MWLLVLFDISTVTVESRRDYRVFRKELGHSGFSRLQKSVYQRHFSTVKASKPTELQLIAILPAEGDIRIISLGDEQIKQVRIYHAKEKQSADNPPKQLEIF